MPHTNPFRPTDVADTQAQLATRAFAPRSWGAVRLTADVIGTLPVANGGTGVTSLSALTANPSASVGLSAVNGSASTFMRSDAAPTLSQAISPTWTGNHTFAPASGNTVFSAGRVGIKITPNVPLHVGDTSTAEQFRMTQDVAYLTGYDSTDTTRVGFLQFAFNGSVNLFSSQNIPLIFGVNDAEVGRFDTNGSLGIGLTPSGSYLLEVNGALSISSATMIRTATSFTNGAGALTGTLTNSPATGNPTKWIPVVDNGTTRYIPAW